MDDTRWRSDEKGHAVCEVAALSIVQVLVGPLLAHERSIEGPNPSLAKP